MYYFCTCIILKLKNYEYECRFKLIKCMNLLHTASKSKKQGIHCLFLVFMMVQIKLKCIQEAPYVVGSKYFCNLSHY